MIARECDKTRSLVSQLRLLPSEKINKKKKNPSRQLYENQSTISFSPASLQNYFLS